MAHTLPGLPYAENALQPHIDAQTMNIHHTKHHNAYITNLNKALDGHADLAGLDIVELCAKIGSVPSDIQTAVRNNGGGHCNHSLFWTVMGPDGGGKPGGALGKAIDSECGGFDKFQQAFAQAATTRFGSGWAWLCVGGDGKLCVCSTPNQDNPLMTGIVECPGMPIIGLDVWEHAYYLNYQNRRPDYIAAWWNVVNWKQVEANYEKAKG